MTQIEGNLRAVTLIAIIVVSTIFVGSVLFIGNLSIGVIGTVATLVFGIFTVYNHYFKLPEGTSDTIHISDIGDSETAGIRPAPEEEGFNMDFDDVVLSELPPKRIAQVIHNSPNWHPDGHGNYSTWWRPRLRRLFFSDVFSNNTFERILLGLTVGGFVLLYFILVSFFPDSYSGVLRPITEVYPSEQPMWRTQVIIFVSIVISAIGTAYFEIKSGSRCMVCQSPFSLQSKKRYFKPENRKIISSSQDDGVEKTEVTYGVHIFQCESCGSWSVMTDTWEKNLESSYSAL